MKKIYPLLLIIPFLSSCATMKRYEIVTSRVMPIYGPAGFADTRYQDIPVGDTIVNYGYNLSDPKKILYKSVPIRTFGFWRDSDVISIKKITRKESKAISRIKTPRSYIGTFLTYEDFEKSESEMRESIVSETIEETPSSYIPSSGATIHTGPRGGRYYINSNGNKTYIKSGSSSPSRSRSSSSSYRRR